MPRKEKKFLQKFMLYFMAFIMVFSIVGIVSLGGFDDGNQNTAEDYGVKFTKKGQYWATDINKKEALFNKLPSEVAYLSIQPEISQKLKNTFQFDITSVVNDSNKEAIAVAFYELDQTLRFNFNKFARQGFTTNTSFNVPILTCDNATETVPVILFRTANETSIKTENNCIIGEAFIQGDFLDIKDAILYHMFGILP